MEKVYQKTKSKLWLGIARLLLRGILMQNKPFSN